MCEFSAFCDIFSYIYSLLKIKNEFLHHRLLDHPNIVKVFELYIDSLKGTIYSVMELVRSKEMFEVIHELGHYSGFFSS